jgi:hypothetical protein
MGIHYLNEDKNQFIVPLNALTNSQLDYIVDSLATLAKDQAHIQFEQTGKIDHEIAFKNAFIEFRKTLICKQFMKQFLIDDFFLKQLEMFFIQNDTVKDEINTPQRNKVLTDSFTTKMECGKTDLQQLKESYDFIVSLKIHPVNPFWQIYHEAINQGIDRVKWILTNKEIIREIVTYQSMADIPIDTKRKYWQTIAKLKK